MTWKVEILNETVVAEVDALPLQVRASLTRILERIELVGLERMREPHVKHLRGKIWEIRASGGEGIGRALYVTAKGKRVVIVLAFTKKTQKTPARLVDLAEERAKDVR